MKLEAKKITYSTAAEVVPVGGFVFTEPYLHECIKAEGKTSYLVDSVKYTTAVALARGLSEEEATNEAHQKYLRGLSEFDIDGFEAAMFWDTYQDIEYSKENPYNVSGQRHD